MDYKAEVLKRLAKPFDYDWRSHGLGMLKTYLDENTRLNLWHSRLVVPNVSGHHTHPWGLRSAIVAGKLTNVRFRREIKGEEFMEGRINCANFNGIEGDPTLVLLMETGRITYECGGMYYQNADEIHKTEFEDGTITIMTRIPASTGGMASIFWPKGSKYGDASRNFVNDDVKNLDISETISACVKQLKALGKP
jgi:hypothetical protein